MVHDSPASRSLAVKQPRRCRSRTTNQPLLRANGNTAAGRRVRDLYRAFVEAMGSPADPISQANAMHAAELTVAVEQQRLAAARGEAMDIDALVRLANLADRAVKRLGIKPVPSKPASSLGSAWRTMTDPAP